MRTKRLIAVMLSLALIFTFASPAFAADGGAAGDVKIMIDGKVINYDGIPPILVGGRTMAPLRQTVEALGGVVVSEDIGEVMTIIFRDRTVTIQPGQNVIDVERAGDSSQVQMDAPPISVDGVTMVPIRFLCYSLGLSTSWDSYAKTVVIIDFEKLCSEIDERYSILNKIMQTTYDPLKTYNAKMEGSQETKSTMSYYGEETETSINMKPTVDMLMKGQSVSMTMKLGLDIDSLIPDEAETPAEPDESVDGLVDGELYDPYYYEEYEQDSGFTEEDIAMLRRIANAEFKIIYNAEEQKFFIQPGDLCEFINQLGLPIEIDADTWIELNPRDLADVMGISAVGDILDALLSGDVSKLTIGKVLALLLNYSDAYYTESYTQIGIVLEVTDALLSDKAFKVSGTSEEPVYELELNAEKIVAALGMMLIRHPELLEEYDMSILELDIEKILTFDLNYKLAVKKDYKFEQTIHLEVKVDNEEFFEQTGAEFADVYMLLDMKSSVPGKTTMSMTQSTSVDNGGYVVSSVANSTYSMDVSITSKTASFTPPAGAKIISFAELFGM